MNSILINQYIVKNIYILKEKVLIQYLIINLGPLVVMFISLV